MANSIIENTLNQAVDVTLSKFNVKELNASEYATINSGFTVNYLRVFQITPHLALLAYDIQGSLNEGETVIGAGTNKIIAFTAYYGASRVVTISGVTYPATAVVFNGAFRIHSPKAAQTSAGMIFILI